MQYSYLFLTNAFQGRSRKSAHHLGRASPASSYHASDSYCKIIDDASKANVTPGTMFSDDLQRYDVATKFSVTCILLPKVVSFKHATQIPASEVLPMKVINMHVFLCYLETRKHFGQGDVFI